MSIQKSIYQTYKSKELPLLTKWHIKRLKKRNPEYEYHFFDDQMIVDFIKKEFSQEVFDLFMKINIGAAKADFFRYAILYKRGGIYLDIDSLILEKIDDIILPSDTAVISLEGNKKNYVQWALFFEAGHPFLKKTLDLVIENLKLNQYPYDVHKMTGPAVYTDAIRACLKHNSDIKYRETGVDYDNKLKFSYSMSKFFLYGLSRKNHWRTVAKTVPVLKS